MEESMMEDSVFEMSDASDDFAPAARPKGKVATAPKKMAAPKATKATKATKAPSKKLVQTSLKTSKAASKKRAKPDSDSEDADSLEPDNEASLLSNTPPEAKKQKKAPAAKKLAGKPLAELENDSMNLDGPPEPKSKGKKTATETYQKLTQLEHILKRPDTYVGSVEREEQTMWVYNSETSQMELRKVTFVPGLYKIFDEIVVNAADNKQNDSSMNYIKVMMDRESGQISVENNGRGIPIEIHAKEKIYIPELIFGHLLAGSNFDDEQAKTTGGRNGYGAKLCNIFSTEFTLETNDSNSGKRYKQTWTGNMSNMGKAKISPSKSSDFTRITFTPDYKKFKMTGIDDDFEALVKRRVYDMAGTMRGVKVYLNGTQIKLNWKSYIEMYAKAINRERGLELESIKDTVIIEKDGTHQRWEIGFAVSDGSFQQVSFVNSIATTSGGTHVNYISDQICDRLLSVVKKRNSKGAQLKNNQIRNHIFLFVNCLITNPAFTSQTKEQLTTRPKQFGSTCTLSEDFLKKIGKTEAVENILNFAAKKADMELAKSDGNRRSRMNNHKLVDANLAGTKRGHECTLILTEGDSAKGLAVSGRAILDPDKIGVFPLRGKLLNVRDASIDQISKNQEIQNIKQFLGLKHKAVYQNTLGLRYGHLMIMTDQDHDGSHIKGLLINFLQVQFPSLLKIPDFLQEFITPIVRVWKGPNQKKPISEKSFFTMPEYETWKERHAGDKTWKYKYYKGLGTSGPEDAQKYFGNLDEHLIQFETMKQEDEDLIELAFSKKKADARKIWLGNFVPGTFLDHSSKTLSFDSFVNRELILFSMADNMRSIPSAIDGLKPGQRKVMYACFKRNLVRDMKVAELGGYVSETTAYHHGETSMYQTIIGLAQNFIGSNNVNCLEPSGNFGTRLAGGSDAASPRYIFTRLSPFARRVFSALDDAVYEYNYDDGRKVEPVNYCPVVPMVLINGAEGIGTGWSTNIPNYSPVDVVNNLKRRMGRLDEDSEEKPFQTMTPWFRGWKGTTEEAGPNRYNFNGIIREAGDTEVEITELPIRVWTDDFKARLEDIIKGEKVPSFIKDYKEFNDHKTVHFIIQLDEKHMKSAIQDGLAERFKLNKTVATSNLVAFDVNGQIRKYETVEEILEEYYLYRFKMYTLRKKFWVDKMEVEYRKMQNQARFVLEIIEGKLIVSKKKKPVLVDELRKREYDPFPKISDAQKAGETEDVVENDEDGVEGDGDDSGAKDYDYLLGMPIWSLTLERVDKLKNQMVNKKVDIDKLKARTEKDLWCEDLDAFTDEWERQLQEDADIEKNIRKQGRRRSRKIGAGKTTGKVKGKDDDEYHESKPKASKPLKADPKANPDKGVVKVENKPHKRFLDMFQPKPKPKTTGGLGSDGAESGISDDDFAALAEPPKHTSRAPSEQAANRSKRAAAAQPKNWVMDDDESESDDGKYLGDVGDMVKGIGEDNKGATGRVSLFAMSRPGTSHGEGPPSSSGLPKPKPKPAKTFDLSDADETNYEMLAKSSPHKAVATSKDDLGSFLSSEDDDMPVVPRAKPEVKKASVAKKPAAKTAPVPVPAAKPKTTQLSPAAKAYAAKQNKMKSSQPVFSDDDIEMVDSGPVIPAAKPSGRSRPAKSKTDDAASKPKGGRGRSNKVVSDDDDSPVAKPKAKAPARKKTIISDDEDDDILIDGPVPASDSRLEQILDDNEDDDVPAAKSKAKAPTTTRARPAKKRVVSDDEDEDAMAIEEPSSPPAKPSGRGRSARAAATAPKSKSVYIDSDEDEDEDMAEPEEESDMVEEDESEEFDDDD